MKNLLHFLSKHSFSLILILLFAFYFITTSRFATGYTDSDELTTIAHVLGIAHPPGYVLITLVIALFQRLFFFINPAFASNILASIIQALCLTLTFKLLQKLIQKPPLILSILTLFFIATTPLIWLHSNTIEVHVFNNLFLLLIIIGLHSFYTTHKLKYFYLTCTLFALCLSQVQTIIMISPAILWLLLNSLNLKTAVKPILKGILIGILTFLLTVIPLYIINSHQASYSWTFPNNLQGIYRMLTRKDYSGFFVSENVTRSAYLADFSKNFISGVPAYFKFTIEHYGFAGFVLFILGLFFLIKKDYRLGIFFFLAWFFSGPFFIGYMGVPTYKSDNLEYQLQIGVQQRQLLLSEAILAFLILYAVSYLYLSTSNKTKKAAIFSMLFIAASLNLYKYRYFFNQSTNQLISLYAHQMLDSAKKDSVIICSADISCFSLFYASSVEGYRPDVTVLTQNNLYRKYFLDENPQYYSMVYQKNPQFTANLIAENLQKRPVYLTNPSTFYIQYLGLDGNPFFLIPNGYIYEVSTIPAYSKTNFIPQASLSLLTHQYPSNEYWYSGLKDYFANAHNFTGMLLAYYNDKDSAVNQFELSLSLKPDYQESIDWIYKFDNLPKEELFRKDPHKDFKGYYLSALDNLKQSNLENAYNNSLKASYLNPHNIDNRLLIANILEKGGYNDLAATEIQQATLSSILTKTGQ